MQLQQKLSYAVSLYPQTVLRLIILIFYYKIPAQAESQSDSCLYGKHASVAAVSCREILDVQQDCYAESGTFLIKDGAGGTYEAYCDLLHLGGGWMRVFSHHYDKDTTCPTGPGTSRGWMPVVLTNGSVYCRRGLPSEGYTPEIQWNLDGSVTYSEIRGYVNLRMLAIEGHNNELDCFSPNQDISLTESYMDGVVIEMPISPQRHIFSYVLGRKLGNERCPTKNNGYPPPKSLPPYGEGSFACDRVNSLLDRDGDGFIIDPVFGDECLQCPLGVPWFQVTLGETVNHPLQLRIVDLYNDDWGLSVTDMEIYVR